MRSRTDRLRDYNAKRNFTQTAEPDGEATVGEASTRDGDELRFIVQKHAARRLHFDFRLEWDGALLSWAVTRGPSADPGQRRLAVRTEDHPLSYASFEGTIAKGQYGAGTVMLWDSGTWQPLHDVPDGLARGKLHFLLAGERMKGGWTLVRMHTRQREKRENWLLIKESDVQASDEEERLVASFETSVSSGRTMDEIRAGSPASKKPKRHSETTTSTRGRMTAAQRSLATPRFVKPQLATLDSDVPTGDGWLHETKFDGYRCLAALGKGGTRLYTRSGLDWSDRFGVLLDGFDALDCQSALIDGEVTAVTSKMSGFSALQAALKSGLDLNFHAFDLLRLDGENLEGMPLLERKRRLAKLIGDAGDGPVKLSSFIVGHGKTLIDRICRAGGEGIVSKRVDATYGHARSRSWLKIKCTKRQEFVVGGYSPSDKRGRRFASLLIGEFSGRRFRYRGRVGSGFSTDVQESLARKLSALEIDDSPFDSVPARIATSAVWVQPTLVAEIDFTELTDGGHVRHGVFLGLRADRPAQAVTRKEVRVSKGKSDTVAGIGVSNPDRVVFGKAKLTKLEIARYYAKASRRLLSIAGNRPMTLFRCPNGIDGECFYQKHAGSGFPDNLRVLETRDANGDVASQMVIDAGKGFVAAVQMGTIEFHMGGARVDDLDSPDRLVFDLDPDEGVSFSAVMQAAAELNNVLEQLGLRSVPLVTGGKGVHVCIPIKPEFGWETAKLFTRTLANAMTAREPERFIATASKAKRKNKIYIDWLRNDRAATAIAPYSVRAREGAPVAMPLTWKALQSLGAASAFDVKAAMRRLGKPCPYLDAQSRAGTLDARVLDRLEGWIASN